MKNSELIDNAINESIKIKQTLLQDTSTLTDIAKVVSDCLKNNSTVFFCGNGGSAADSQHIAAEFVGRFNMDRIPLPAESLTTNTSILTAIGNDYSFDEIFSRQVQAKVTKSDLLIGISTSGKSKNVLRALEEAKRIGAKTIGFTGKNTKEMKEFCEMVFEEVETGKNFLYGISRSGSPFTDWHYSWEDEPDEIECSEVKKVEVTTHKWKVVK